MHFYELRKLVNNTSNQKYKKVVGNNPSFIYLKYILLRSKLTHYLEINLDKTVHNVNIFAYLCNFLHCFS